MAGYFADLRRALATVKDPMERERLMDRQADELDRMRDAMTKLSGGSLGIDNGTAVGSAAGQAQKLATAKPDDKGTALMVSGISVEPDIEYATAAGQDILPDQLVSFIINASGIPIAHLARADNALYPADSICTKAIFRSGVRRILCSRKTTGKPEMRVRLATAGMPAVGADMYVSATVPGAVTDNLNDSPSRIFNQRIGTFVRLAQNAQKQIQTTVAIIDPDFSPPPSLPAAASA